MCRVRAGSRDCGLPCRQGHLDIIQESADLRVHFDSRSLCSEVIRAPLVEQWPHVFLFTAEILTKDGDKQANMGSDGPRSENCTRGHPANNREH
jgi:hypothetical protein